MRIKGGRSYKKVTVLPVLPSLDKIVNIFQHIFTLPVVENSVRYAIQVDETVRILCHTNASTAKWRQAANFCRLTMVECMLLILKYSCEIKVFGPPFVHKRWWALVQRSKKLSKRTAR